MSYIIPLFDLNYGQEEIEAVADTIRDNWISTGPRCEQFEQEFATALGARHALTLDNCTNCLFLAMRLLNIKEGDEVLVPSLSFVASVNCVRYVGAKPVFCDINSITDLTISADDIEKKITPNTKAIIVMHYGGFPCDMSKIIDIAQKHNLKVVEDACHGPLSEYGGQKLGTIGDIGCFSFFSNKNISTGEGGMMVLKGDEYYERAKLLRSHGMTTTSYQRAGGHATKYDVVDIGYNFRMDDIHAALGLAQLAKLKPDLQKRALVRKWYEEILAGIDSIVVPFERHQGFVTNYIFVVALSSGGATGRDKVRERLHSAGIQTSVHYPAIHRFSAYHDNAFTLPKTEFAADHLITLPMYSKLTESNIEYIGSVLREALQ